MSREDNRKILIEILKKHPEGLTIASLSKISGLHRHTSTKYIYELIGAGLVLQRSVGAAKLCYLKRIEKNKENKILEDLEKRRFIEKYNLKLIVSVVLITFLLSEVAILAYENNSLNETLSINTSPLTSSILLNESNISQLIENASNLSVENNESTFNLSINSTFNETINETLPLESIFEIRIDYPEKITRNEEFTIKAYLKNIGSFVAKNIAANWILPEGVEIISTNSDCKDLEPEKDCSSEITVKLGLSTKLGKNDFKVVINYEK